MKQFQEFLALVKKNKYFLLVILGIIILLQILSKGAEPTVSHSPESQWEESINQQDELNNQQSDPSETPTRRRGNDFSSIIILAFFVVAYFLAKKYGYLDKIMDKITPSIFILRTSYFKQKSTNHLVIKVLIINKTKSDVSLNNPTICFYKGKDVREFTIKNIGGQNYFPLTLMPNTGHKFVIDAQKFYDNVQDLKDHKSIQMKICSSSGKCYKSIKWPVSLTFKTIK